MEKKTSTRVKHNLDCAEYSENEIDSIDRKRKHFESASSNLKFVDSYHTAENTMFISNRHNREVQASQWSISNKMPWCRRIKLWFNRLLRKW